MKWMGRKLWSVQYVADNRVLPVKKKLNETEQVFFAYT